MLSRHAINACHVTYQRQMELDSMMVFDAQLCPATLRSVGSEVPELPTQRANQRRMCDNLGIAGRCFQLKRHGESMSDCVLTSTQPRHFI